MVALHFLPFAGAFRVPGFRWSACALMSLGAPGVVFAFAGASDAWALGIGAVLPGLTPLCFAQPDFTHVRRTPSTN